MRIAMLQMDVAEGDKERNIRHGFDLLEEAASSADVLVMPELWTIGYNFHDFKNRVTRVNDGLLDRLSSFAAYHHVTLEAGTLPIAKEGIVKTWGSSSALTEESRLITAKGTFFMATWKPSSWRRAPI